MAEQLPFSLRTVELNDEKLPSHPKAIAKFLQTENSHPCITDFLNNFHSEKIDRMFDFLATKKMIDKKSYQMECELQAIFSVLK